ncbi:hypothetical protein GCM10010478_64360 [Streptomyces erythrogriseus]|uniref:Uncharacterized protein n=1 Tax=Streptomyces erythrogriseus TaxID=284027 RepID=A0ABN3XGJ7_9ACTN
MKGLDGDAVEGGGGRDVRGDTQFGALLSFVPLQMKQGAQGVVGCLGDDVETMERPALGQICGHPVARCRVPSGAQVRPQRGCGGCGGCARQVVLGGGESRMPREWG